MTTEQKSPKLWPAAVLLVSGWLVLVAFQFFQIRFGLWAMTITPISWIVPIFTTVGAALLSSRRARWLGPAVSLGLSVVVGVVVAMVNWPHIYITTWYQWHRSDFAAVARLGDDQNWTRSAPDGYFGPELPAEYQYLSTVRSLSQIGVNHGTPVWFLAQFTGIPDCAAGYAHFTGDGDPSRYAGDVDSNDYLDGFGCAVKPKVDLGDGWWWVE